ncbi:MAG: hypothetical protein IJT27_01490, partial [Clostridia bacterium]|nr:hypothetical protein [Clostridia bacterium]
MQKIGVCGTCFADEKGRQRIFNGYNVVYKGCEADADGVVRYRTELNEEAVAGFAKQGMNIVRLGVTWAGIEPDMTFYNET